MFRVSVTRRPLVNPPMETFTLNAINGLTGGHIYTLVGLLAIVVLIVVSKHASKSELSNILGPAPDSFLLGIEQYYFQSLRTN